MKTLWAVACSAGVIGVLMLVAGGCATSPQKPGEAKPSGQSEASGQGNDKLIREIRTDIPEGASVSYGPNYRIGPEDVLHVSVWDNKDLTLDVPVRPDGKISLPLIQDVQAEGLTAAELSDVIHLKLLPFLKEPNVAVIVTQVNAPKVFVIGYVARPGPYPMRSDMSILEALSLAGGFTPFASPKSIKVVRKVGGKQEIRKVNYYEMLDAGGGSYLLKPGDMIVVP